MNKEIIAFSDIEIEKLKFHIHENPILILKRFLQMK